MGESHTSQYVHTDARGVMRVGGTRVMIDGVVHAFLEGDSPEAIQEQYPSLTLEQVYGVIAYYLAHRQEVDGYLAGQEKAWEGLRAECDHRMTPVVERLREIKRRQRSQPA